MSLSVWDLFKFFYKWKWGIALFTVLCFVLASWYVDKNQTYSSKIIIQYNDGCISQGKTLHGDVFDPNEIKSPSVVLNVLKELGYENKKIDSVRENISISAITPTSADNLKAAKEKLGEEYKFFPKTFIVTYKGNSSFESTRDILSSVIANYFKYYSETYLYLASLNEVDYHLNQKNFDYIEQIEQIRDNLKQTITSLSSYSKDSAGYRSPTTGLTFDDLLKDFERLNEYSVPYIFSKILEGQVTEDKDLLINKYTERIESNRRDFDNLIYKAEVAKTEMDAYVKANKQVPNSYNEIEEDGVSKAQIIQDVEYDKNGEIDEQTTYDNLIISYANDKIAANNKEIDARYCQSVIDRFTGRRADDIDYDACETVVKEEIAEVLNSLAELYKKANINISDYNSYIPAMHIKKLSGVGYYANLSGALYKIIAIIGGLGISSAVAIAYEVIKKYSKFDGDDYDEPENDENEIDEEAELRVKV